MGLLTTQDKEIIKRALPKGSNKILDVAVARLYIAYPDRNKWKFTGLSGALVLVDDLVGNTFFLKLIDIYGHRGIIWDQELYVGFEYFQDRTFFHTFEIEDCFAGFLFVDINEAQHFLKRVQRREKYGSRKTLMNKNAIAMKKVVNKERAANVTQGPRGETIMGDQRKRYNYNNAEHIPETRKKAPPPPPPSAGVTTTTDDYNDDNDDYDNDSYQNFSDEYDNNNNYDTVSSVQQSEDTTEAEPNVAEETKTETPAIRHKVPPLPAEFAHPTGQAPPLPGQNAPAPHANNPFPIPVPQPSQTTPFPIPPVSQPNQFQPQLPNGARPVPQAPGGIAQSPVPLPPRQVPQPPAFGGQPQQPTFGAQPQKYGSQPGRVPSFGTQLPARGGNAPAPPPPRRGPAPPPPPHRHGGQPIPNSNGMMMNNNAARPSVQPPAPRRGPVPPPPPRGGARPAMQQPGQLPPKTTIPAPSMSPVNNGYTMPGMAQSPISGTPPVTTFNTSADVPQMTPPTTFGMPMPQAPPAPVMPQAQAVPPAPPAPAFPQAQAVPPAPTMPQAQAVPPAPPAPAFPQAQAIPPAPPAPAFPQAQAIPPAPPAPAFPQAPPAPAMPGAPGAPPPPPAFLTQPQAGGPPPAPAPPPMGGAASQGPALSESTGDVGRDALLASIRGAGGIGALKKVDKSQLDKPSVLLQEARGEPAQNTSSSAPGGPPGGGPGGSLADALAAALNKRKNKVGAHDDDDAADDW